MMSRCRYARTIRFVILPALAVLAAGLTLAWTDHSCRSSRSSRRS